MRVIGIDPGTGSFDFFGMDGDEVIIDASIAVPRVAEDPGVLLETIRGLLPLDLIIGPSGYGLPLRRMCDMSAAELDFMVPDDPSVPLYDGIRRVLRKMQSEKLPVVFTPGAIQLPTIPSYRKSNKMDMGTADKVCCAALAIKDQADCLGMPLNRTSFILAEVGYAFSAALAVENGRIIDGLGGTSGGPGFVTLGCMDAELAVRLGNFPGAALFSGGARDETGNADITPYELARKREIYPGAWKMLVESVAKNVAAMTVALPEPREILISGRLTGIPELADDLAVRLARFGSVRKVGRKAGTAKEAAEGAFIIGEGLAGGKYRGIIECLELNKACGTMYDYLTIRGVNVPGPG